ncbi:MAG: ABC transporter permease [Candidatus Hydrothermarchaeales archaeon]
MGAIYTIWLREMKLFTRNRSRLIGSLATPFFWLAFVGIGLSTSFEFPGLSVDYLDFMTPGIIGMGLLFFSMFSGISVLWDKQFGFMKEMMVAPISRRSIVLGKTAGGTTAAMFQAIIILLMAKLMGVGIAGVRGSLFSIPFMILISAGFVSLGLSFAARMEDPHGFQMIMSFIMMPLFFLSGALFPLVDVPAWLKFLAYLDPLTYGVDGLRGTLINTHQFPLLLDISILVIFSIAMVSLGSFLFESSSV